jgi:peroxiredoxin Q/BCP
VSFDPVAANKAFAEKFDFNFQLLSDTSRAMGIAYGAADDASTQYARRCGVLIGPDGKVSRYWPKASAKEFPFEALAAIS